MEWLGGLEVAGIDMQVVAPSKTPRASGDRVKTDRKDAEFLARLLLAGQLHPVTVPPAWLEAIRHLARTREQVRHDLMRARHRVSTLLLVHGRVYPGKTAWNQTHKRWLAQQSFEHRDRDGCQPGHAAGRVLECPPADVERDQVGRGAGRSGGTTSA